MLYLFENYALDTDRRELRRGDTLISVEPKVFDLLAYLIANCDRVVSKDDLIGAIWEGRIVSDAALTTRLNAARSAIADSGEEQRLIKTLPRKGIRFVGQINEAKHPEAPATSALALPDKPSLAVLPFTNMSGDPEQEYFADGIADDIITELSHVSSLFVVARNSSFAFKNKSPDIREVGRQLGVRYVLEGSVRRSAGRLRVAAQLIDAADGKHVWAERYDRRVQDIFDIQDELTKEIVTALRIKLTDGEQASVWLRSTNNIEAWGYAMRGADHLWRGTAASMAEARSLLERAVATDPTYAKAMALLALTYYFDTRFNYGASQGESKHKHAEYAAKALALDPEEPYSLLMRSGVRSFEGRFAEAFEDVKRALDKSPNDAYCWVRAARILIHLDRGKEAEEAIRYAMRLNPFYPIQYLAVLGDALAHQDCNEEAIAVFDEVVKREPKYMSGYVHLARAHSALGNENAARSAAAEALRIDPKYTIAAAASLYLSVNKKRRDGFLRNLESAGFPPGPVAVG